ncbi:MAG: nucleophile aminohydrolase [Olpidium bornovanus]|uniref:proteasome endopeptidase complex n=1 Tax=Olpidium bornovanus TaxID=278681 RepID=A0A8H8DJ40_9FUNG|nr:MAG: nucleophile aminohydrolase [Olpidium bornovanus]
MRAAYAALTSAQHGKRVTAQLLLFITGNTFPGWRLEATDRSSSPTPFKPDAHRNIALEGRGYHVPKATKTGTTIVGVIFEGTWYKQQDGVCLGADTRATEGPIVADKNCAKIHYLAPNMYCCGAGTAADTAKTTDLISSQLELHRLSTGRESRVVTAMTLLKQMLFKYQGHIGAALVLGGYDFNGPQLFTIHPHGSTDKLPFVTMGSGSLAAMAIFESRYKPNMTVSRRRSLISMDGKRQVHFAR